MSPSVSDEDDGTTPPLIIEGVGVCTPPPETPETES